MSEEDKRGVGRPPTLQAEVVKVVEELYQNRPLAGQEIVEELGRRLPDRAASTLRNGLTGARKKGLIHSEKVGRYFLYSPAPGE